MTDANVDKETGYAYFWDDLESLFPEHGAHSALKIVLRLPPAIVSGFQDAGTRERQILLEERRQALPLWT